MLLLWTLSDLGIACALIALATALAVFVSRVVLGIRLPPLRREPAADDCAFAASAAEFGMSPDEALGHRGIPTPSAADGTTRIPGLPRREQRVLDRAPRGTLAFALATIGYGVAWPSRRRTLFLFPALLIGLLIAVWLVVIAVIVSFFEDIYNQLGAELPWLTMVMVDASHLLRSVKVAVIAIPAAVLLLVLAARWIRRAGVGRHDDIRVDTAEPGAMERCASISKSGNAHCAWRSGKAPEPRMIEANLMPESAAQANSGAIASQLVIAIAVSAVLLGFVTIALYLPLFNIPKVIGR